MDSEQRFWVTFFIILLSFAATVTIAGLVYSYKSSVLYTSAGYEYLYNGSAGRYEWRKCTHCMTIAPVSAGISNKK